MSRKEKEGREIGKPPKKSNTFDGAGEFVQARASGVSEEALYQGKKHRRASPPIPKQELTPLTFSTVSLRLTKEALTSSERSRQRLRALAEIPR